MLDYGEPIYTNIYSERRGGRDYLDDPRYRERYAKHLSDKQRIKFAKSFLESVFKAREEAHWWKRMSATANDYQWK